MSDTPTDIVTTKKPAKPHARYGSLEHLANTEAKKADVKRIMQNVLKWYNMTPIKTDEECEQRIAAFFLGCAEDGSIPTVEKMCLALGYDRRTVWAWEDSGLLGSPKRQDIIKRAKNYLSSFDAELLLENKVNPVSYIFRAKNYYGMVDKTEHVLTPNTPLGNIPDLKEIENRIVSD